MTGPEERQRDTPKRHKMEGSGVLEFGTWLGSASQAIF